MSGEIVYLFIYLFIYLLRQLQQTMQIARRRMKETNRRKVQFSHLFRKHHLSIQGSYGWP